MWTAIGILLGSLLLIIFTADEDKVLGKVIEFISFVASIIILRLIFKI